VAIDGLTMEVYSTGADSTVKVTEVIVEMALWCGIFVGRLIKGSVIFSLVLVVCEEVPPGYHQFDISSRLSLPP